MRKIIPLCIVFLLCGIIFLPIVNSLKSYENDISQISINNKNLPSKNVFVIRYIVSRFSFERECIEMSINDLISLEEKITGIQTLKKDITEKNSMIKQILTNYNLIEDQYMNDLNLISTNSEDKYSEKLLFSRVTGTFGPSFINLAHIAKLSPLFLSIAKGVDFEIVNFPGRTTFHSENLVKFFAIGVIGTILILPFFSPFGYIDASVLVGKISEMRNN